MKGETAEKLNVHLKGDVAEKFKRIKAYLGLEQDTEVIRSLISYYYNLNQKELTGPPKTMWHVNLNENGVMVWDPFIDKAVLVQFTREGIECQYDKSDNCRHVQFALSREAVKEVVRQRRKEGWHLPDI